MYWPLVAGAKEPQTDRPGCGLECFECMFLFQMQFGLPGVWPNQHFYVSVSFLAFCSIFILCRSQCESKPFPNISVVPIFHLYSFYTSFVPMCHFAYFRSVEACSPWKYCAQMITQNVANVPKCKICHSLIKDV